MLSLNVWWLNKLSILIWFLLQSSCSYKDHKTTWTNILDKSLSKEKGRIQYLYEAVIKTKNFKCLREGGNLKSD